MLENTLELARHHAGTDLCIYTDCVRSAFEEVDPIFVRHRYSEFFWHCASTVPGWLPQVVLGNCQAESDGSAKLLDLWQHVNFNESIEDQVLFHARDEARHARIFVQLAEACFPATFPHSFLSNYRATLTKIEKRKLVKSDSPIDGTLLIDHLVQMNMGEIRTRLHMELLAPVLYAFAPPENKKQVEDILEGLASDEVVHIGYIANILEEMCQSGDTKRVQEIYVERLRDFNEFTRDQTESAIAQFGNGLFPDLLEI